MIAATKFHYAFKQKANHSSSDYLKSMDVAQIDFYVNEAIDVVISSLIPKAEIDSEIREHLRLLEIKNKSLTFDRKDGYIVAPYPEDYFKRLRQWVIATNEYCGDQKRTLIVRIIQSDDLSEILKSPNWNPSWDFEETVGDESKDGLHIWEEGFKIETVLIDYYKKPEGIAAPSLEKCGFYINESGITVSQDKNFELDSTFLWRTIVDVAVLMAERDTSEVRDYQTQLQIILFKAKI